MNFIRIPLRIYAGNWGGGEYIYYTSLTQFKTFILKIRMGAEIQHTYRRKTDFFSI